MIHTRRRANRGSRRCVASAKRSTTKAGGHGALFQQTVTRSCARLVNAYENGAASGVLLLTGEFDEILGLARNEEARVKAEHPLARIIKIEDQVEAPAGLANRAVWLYSRRYIR